MKHDTFNIEKMGQYHPGELIMFGWPSGLGSRLQNEIGRFDSDSKLKNISVAEWFRQQSPKLYGQKS